MNDQDINSDSHQTINFKDLISILYNEKKLIILSTLFFVILSVSFVLYLPNKYIATALLEVNSHDSDSTITSISGQLGGLGSLAGISLPGESSKAEYAVAYIKSKKMLSLLLTQPGVRENLFATKSYNKITKKITYDSKIFNSQTNEWVRKVKVGEKKIPSLHDIHQDIISKQLSVSINRKSGFILISFTHISPVFAKEYVDLIIQVLNSEARMKDLDESKEALTYYNNKIKNAENFSIKNSINKLIELELKKEMLGSLQIDYLLIPIDGPFIPEKKSEPQRSLIVILISMFGFALSISYVLIRKFIL
ncbi:Wzz/FepE/Etk N-terminal domain-containing protein [Gammaproteobacteria bacterium]|nr:Wzz/FepE/Etk N-terminal domain-containing protein [Gammaproteobacteria bacterium]